MKTKKTITTLLASLMTCSLFAVNTLHVFAEGEGGEPPSSSNNGGTPPDKPEGDTSGPQMEGGQAPDGQPGEGGGGANTQSFDYTGSYTGSLTASGNEVESSNETITATESDQNATLSQNGGTLTIDSDTIEKSGDDDNGDNCNFYGLNSAVLSVGSGSLTKISNSSINATSTGSNAIFATDSATVYSYNNKITTSSDNSRGLDATYAGTIIADSMDISTQGNHSATVATDRGGGSVSLTNSTLSTAGSGSPLLYSTGDIEVDNVTGTSTGSQIVGMEGLNTMLIYNSQLSSTNNAISGSDPIKNGIIIYQSTSGDADTSTGEAATFNAVNSILSTTIDSGSMFYLTNTSANIVLSQTILTFDSDNVNLLQVEGNNSNSWGSEGSNGATVNFTGLNENLTGNISVDTISTANIYLLEATTYTGSTSITTNAVNTKATDAPITMNISSDSTWIVTQDSTVTNLNVEDGATIQDAQGRTVTIIANGETVVSGDSDYTITVTRTYGTSFETSSANELTTDYIDREEFDATYNVSTTFSTNGTTTQQTTEVNETTTDTTTTDQTSDNTLLYVGVGVVAVAIILGTFVLIKKK